MEAPLAAVTGGTGFLGGHIVDALLADGWRVRALVRRAADERRWAPGPVETVRGDLGDADSLHRLCQGARAVVHAAGAIKARRSADFEAVNAGGAARMAAAAKAAAPGARFVLVSSLAAREPGLSAYARSKRHAEEAVRRDLGAAASIARPCALYGPRDRETLGLFRAAARSPVLPVLGERARVCLMHGADAGRAIAALAGGSASGPVELSDARPQGYGWREIMAAAAAAVGARPRLVRVPAQALRALGLVADARRRLGVSSVLSSGKVRELLHEDWSVRVAAAPVPPRFGLAAGFRQTVDWYREQGWLP